MLLILKRFWLKPIKKESKFVAQFENGKASVGLHSSQKTILL
jgi:hypothetical protein